MNLNPNSRVPMLCKRKALTAPNFDSFGNKQANMAKSYFMSIPFNSGEKAKMACVLIVTQVMNHVNRHNYVDLVRSIYM